MKRTEIQLRYYEKNKEEINAKRRVANMTDEQKEKAKKRSQEYYQKNKLKITANVEEWQKNNREKCVEYQKQYNKRNKQMKSKLTDEEKAERRRNTVRRSNERRKQRIQRIRIANGEPARIYGTKFNCDGCTYSFDFCNNQCPIR